MYQSAVLTSEYLSLCTLVRRNVEAVVEVPFESLLYSYCTRGVWRLARRRKGKTESAGYQAARQKADGVGSED